VTLLTGVTAAAVAVAIVASGATARSTQVGSVCVLLPDTKSSVRWEQFDKPAFVNGFKKAGIKATVVNALNDPQKQLSQAEQCISAGAKVGIITSLDTGTSIAIQKKFTAAGGKTIDYDRQIVGGTGSVYADAERWNGCGDTPFEDGRSGKPPSGTLGDEAERLAKVDRQVGQGYPDKNG
jgi:D-xylose transport system substrate-binding protein